MSIFNIFGINERKPLCVTCTYAHIERGFNGEESTFCSFVVAMRPVIFAVSECTDYRDRYAASPVKVTGFVNPREFEEMETG